MFLGKSPKSFNLPLRSCLAGLVLLSFPISAGECTHGRLPLAGIHPLHPTQSRAQVYLSSSSSSQLRSQLKYHFLEEAFPETLHQVSHDMHLPFPPHLGLIDCPWSVLYVLCPQVLALMLCKYLWNDESVTSQALRFMILMFCLVPKMTQGSLKQNKIKLQPIKRLN